MELKLTNPIVFFDLETTGINIAKDKIVEISVLKVMPNGKEEQKTIRVNPEMHIPEQASAIHGIYDDDVKDCPTFKEIAKDLARYIEGCDLGGYNSNRFDIPLLAEEFLRVDVDFDMGNGSSWTCRRFSIRWSNVRYLPLINSIAIKAWRTLIRLRLIRWLHMRC